MSRIRTHDRPKALRVLVVIDALGEGGTERSLAELVPGLRGQGINISVAILKSRGEEGVEGRLRQDGVDIRVLPSGFSRFRALRLLVEELRPDIVHSMLFAADQTTRLASLGWSSVVLTSLVNTSYSPARYATPGTKKYKMRLVQLVDGVTGRLFVDWFHAVSAAVARDAVDNLRVPAARLRVVNRGRVDPRMTLPPEAGRTVRGELGIGTDQLLIINVGRQEYQKDHATLIAAVAPLLARRTNAYLVLVGRQGNATQTLDRALSPLAPDVRRRVLLLGHRADVAALLAAADVFVMTARYEGLPGVVIEAMAAGLPVVASDIDPVHEVVEPERSALLAAPGDVAGFASALETLLGDASLRADLGVRGRSLFEERFTIDAAVEGMAALYHSVATVTPTVLK